MSTPAYEQLLEFYYGSLANQQACKRDEQDIIELLRALLEGYHTLAENIVELRVTVNKQNAQIAKTGLTRKSAPPFFDLYSDIHEDFSH